MFKDQHHPTDWIKSELSLKKAKNPNYSLRAFAKNLQITPGRLSEILNHKRQLNFKLAEKIATRLNWNDSQKKDFLNSVQQMLKQNKIQKSIQLKQKINLRNTDTNDLLLAITQNQHSSILQFCQNHNNLTKKEILDFISLNLKLEKAEVKKAIDRLARMQLLRFKKNRVSVLCR